jgi:hypothetical protein
VKKLTEKIMEYRGFEQRNPDDFRRFKDKLLDLTKDALFEGYSNTDGKVLSKSFPYIKYTHRTKFYLMTSEMSKVFKDGFPVEYLMTSFEDVSIFKYKNGYKIQVKGENGKEYLHEFTLLPACQEEYYRDWNRDGICVKKVR